MFHADSRARDGIVHRCKTCITAEHHKWYLENREAVLERARKKREANPPSSEQYRERNAKYYQEWKRAKLLASMDQSKPSRQPKVLHKGKGMSPERREELVRLLSEQFQSTDFREDIAS